MPAVIELSKERIVKVAVKMVNDNGWESINARSLAASLGVSTKPLYRIYNNMDEIKEDIYKEISHLYDEFLTSRIDSKKALLTLCIAYVEFAQEYKNLFISLFLSNILIISFPLLPLGIVTITSLFLEDVALIPCL